MSDTSRFPTGVYIEQAGTLPSDGVDGSLITYAGALYQRQSGVWVALTGGGGGGPGNTAIYTKPEFVSVVGTTAEVEVWSFTIPADSLTDGQILTVDHAMAYFADPGEGVTIRLKLDGLETGAVNMALGTGGSDPANGADGLMSIKVGYQGSGTFAGSLSVAPLFVGTLLDTTDTQSTFYPLALHPGFDPSVSHTLSLSFQLSTTTGVSATCMNVHADIHQP